MKIYIDNESEDFRKIVSIKSNYNMDIGDDLDTIIDALKAYGYDLEMIQAGFIDKCIHWEFINTKYSDEEFI